MKTRVEIPRNEGQEPNQRRFLESLAGIVCRLLLLELLFGHSGLDFVGRCLNRGGPQFMESSTRQLFIFGGSGKRRDDAKKLASSTLLH